MAQGDKVVIPAQAGGFASLFGKIEKGTGDTLNLPEGMVNIGGNGKGYLLSAEVDWDPTTNDDGTVSALALGDDVYIYAVQDASGAAQWIASANSTYPTGYSASTSRKIGGFHYGRVRSIADRYNTSITPATQIVPNSCWDLQHRPTCDPTGMVEVISGSLWVDIYLNSEGSGAWPENVPVSAYGATLIKDDVYARSDFHQLVANAGKRLPTVEEFLRYAEGAPAGLLASNDQAWTSTGNSGATTSGAVAKAVSQYNVVDAVGNLWDWLDNHYDEGGTRSWSNTDVNVGKDSAIARGYVFRNAWRAFGGGGNYTTGEHSGARALNSAASPWDDTSQYGFRGVCDAL